jgi:hypothetical protein
MVAESRHYRSPFDAIFSEVQKIQKVNPSTPVNLNEEVDARKWQKSGATNRI